MKRISTAVQITTEVQKSSTMTLGFEPQMKLTEKTQKKDSLFTPNPRTGISSPESIRYFESIVKGFIFEVVQQNRA